MSDTLLTTKITVPRLPRRVLLRAGLLERLRDALEHRLTVLQAGAGYGKTTTMAALVQHLAGVRCAWVSLDTSDRDPQQFLQYLIGAIGKAVPQFPATASLALNEAVRADAGPNGQAWLRVVDVLVNDLNDLPDELLLILDDYQWVADAPAINDLLGRLLRFLPAGVHVALASRCAVDLPGMAEWQAKGGVLQVGVDKLALDRRDIAALFGSVYGISLSDEAVDALLVKTDGWPIALQLAWQGLREAGATAGTLALLQQGPQSLGALFAFLAQDVVARQSEEVRKFLRTTAVLGVLSPPACGALGGVPDARGMLASLYDAGLFMTALGNDCYRFHPLFREFLIAQMPQDEVHAHHRAAADYFLNTGDVEQSIAHYLGCAAFAQAADAIEGCGERIVAAGRLDMLEGWLRALPPAIVKERAALIALQGDLARLRGHLDAAQASYREAERLWRDAGDNAGVSEALRRQALVFLDSGVQTQELLEQALALAERHAAPEQKLRLLDMLAENSLNIGQPEQARAWREQAQALRGGATQDDRLSVRILLRTGRVRAAQDILQGWWRTESEATAAGRAAAPAAHRETALLLSFIHGMSGDADAALTMAREGIARGESLGSPMLAMFGYTRLGHAWQLLADAMPPATNQAGRREHALAESLAAYRTALGISDEIGVRRARLEIMFGLARLSVRQQDIDASRRHAQEARELAQWCGDAWIGTHIDLLQASLDVELGQTEQALPALLEVLARLRACGDALGEAAAQLQLALAYRALVRVPEQEASLAALLSVCEAQGFDFLLTRPTLFGLTQSKRAVPLLIHARDIGCHAAYAGQLLASLGLPDIVVHPGFSLRIQTLGGFRVWRGEREIDSREWRRASARELLQLLAAERGRWMSREQIMETLKPGIDPDAAVRDFKAALAALTAALESDRHADQASAFIAREGVAYRLRPEADIWLDAVAFERQCQAALTESRGPGGGQAIDDLEQTLALYGGEFLPDAREAEWTAPVRERLAALWQRAALRLAEGLLGQGRFDACVAACERVLAADACCERAYQLVMAAQARSGERAEAIRTYRRCEESLRRELGIGPGRETLAMLQQLVGDA